MDEKETTGIPQYTSFKGINIQAWLLGLLSPYRGSSHSSHWLEKIQKGGFKKARNKGSCFTYLSFIDSLNGEKVLMADMGYVRERAK